MMKTHRLLPLQSLSRFLRTIHPLSVLILKTGLPIILLQLIALTVYVDEGMKIDPFYTFTYYSKALEYVALSLTILVGGAALYDICFKKK